MSKNKFLLVEYTTHFRNALDNFEIFQKFYDCYLLTSKEKQKYLKLRNKKIIFKLPKFIILFYIILNGYKYKYIYFSTPHEYPDYPKGFIDNIYFFYYFILYEIILLIYKNKVILQLRSLHRYFPEIPARLNKPTLYSRLRRCYLNQCGTIICESENLKNKLKKYLKKKKYNYKNIMVIYYAYSKKNTKIKFKLDKKKINIGILGTVDSDRKDYNILTKILENKLFSDRVDSLTFLGSANNVLGKKIIKEFSKFSKKIITKNYFSEKDFLKFGKKCDFLISLNNKTNFYGETRMSGCFGDAILLKKYLYCPTFEDPYREFSDFTYYFKNTKELLTDIKHCSKKNKTIFFDRSKYEQLYKTIKNNLQID